VIDARFGHVNLIARDWRSLADFYVRLFGCEAVPPEHDDPRGRHRRAPIVVGRAAVIDRPRRGAPR
jgi:catechol 2,3-dioxygenase-like lactoylglutathione lyase family enzyme